MTVYDTNIMIDYLRGDESIAEAINSSRDEKGVSISAISCYELLNGAHGDEFEAVESLFGRVNIYPMDLSSARTAGELSKKLKKDGGELSIADTLILAVAKANDETFVTRDSGFAGTYDKLIILKK